MPVCRLILFFFIQIFFCATCFAQKERIASLTKALPALKDSARIDCLNELSEAYYETQTDTARMHAKQALKEAEKISYTAGMAKAYRWIGFIESKLETDWPAAENYFSLALTLCIKTGDEQQVALAWRALGYAKWVLCKFPEAMEAYEKAVQHFEKVGDTTNLSKAYHLISITALEWGHYEKALQYAFKYGELTGEESDILYGLYQTFGDYETTLEHYRQSPSEGRGWQWKYMALGSIFYLKKQFDSANYYYRRYTEYAKTAREGPACKLYASLGEAYFALKRYDTALLYLEDALNIFEKSKDRNQVMRMLLMLGKTYKEKGNYKSAMQTVRELLQIANETGARQFSRDAHLLLSEIFGHLHKQDSAYSHLRQYTILKDSIDLDLSAQKLAFYKTKSEREQAQSKISALNDEKKLQQQRIKQTAQQKNFLIVGIIAVLLIAVVIFRYILLKRKNERLRMEHELELQQLESEKTKAELQQQATELEMQALRAQMNPHFIFNSLNSINMFILENNKLQASDYLSKFSRLVRLILQNSQEAFIPLDRELEALRLYLELESLRFEQRFDYKISVNNEVDVSIVKVPPLIIQPYAENAIWHGLMHKKEKGHLEIELYLQEKILYCKITDDGIGRKRAEELKSKSSLTYKSMGMRITADRIAILQKQEQNKPFISVNDLVFPDSRPAGTEVLIQIPITK